jgi:squalene-hopene/tetraprenyl-beta-curcumene cyclase
MKERLGFGIVAALLVGSTVLFGADKSVKIAAPESGAVIDESLRHEIEAAIDRGLDWLAANQKADGSWSDPHFPALTALPLWAFARSEHKDAKTVVPKAVSFIKGCVQDDGGIYRKVPGRKGGGLGNYNTAICMTALHGTGDKSLARIIQNARTYIAKGQHRGDDVYRGGFGYDKSTNRAYTDLMNTLYSAEAMRLTQDVEDLRPAGEKKVDVDWKAAAEFVSSMQNKPAAGEDQAGGFFYMPGQSKAGTTTNANGVVVLRSYGSMTYAGMLALIYSHVDRDDPRVRSAFDWACKHWTLEENPGMGAQGLFFFYNVISRSLSAYGADMVKQQNGDYVNWRKEVAKHLLARQHIDPKTGQGYWLNKEGRFWERNSVLVTAYSVLALEQLLGH